MWNWFPTLFAADWKWRKSFFFISLKTGRTRLMKCIYIYIYVTPYVLTIETAVNMAKYRNALRLIFFFSFSFLHHSCVASESERVMRQTSHIHNILHFRIGLTVAENGATARWRRWWGRATNEQTKKRRRRRINNKARNITKENNRKCYEGNGNKYSIIA